MALKQITLALGRMAVCEKSTATLTSSVITSHKNIAAFSANLQLRSFFTTPLICHKMDTRAFPPWKHPGSKNGRWVLRKKFTEMYDYTTDPLPFPKTGGRGPNGRIWNHRRGGGRSRVFYMVDGVRGGPTEGPPRVEKIKEIKEDVNRSARIALVVSGESKRYIMATGSMKVGDIIQSSRVLSKTAVRPKEGDSYPLGSLPLGTMVSCIEKFPGDGGVIGRAAGVSCEVIRKVGDKCVVRMPSKREMMVSTECTATVGRMSNELHNKKKWGKAGAKRLAGFRPRSGRWHRKTGRFGRKVRPIKPIVMYDNPTPIPAGVTRVKPPMHLNIY